MIRKFSVLKKTFFIYLFYFLYGITLTYSIRLQGVSDLIHNLEGMDPEVLNLFTFSNKPAYRNVEDTSEINIMDVDTSDILNCFSTLSYVCFQKKILVYLDSLNRVDKINLFGGYLSFVRVSKGLTPPITEQLLASRHITDESTLSTLLREVFDDFVDTHILRITVPVINTRLDSRSARGHCYDFNLGDNKDENGTSGSQGTAKDPTCYRGDQGMVALSSALVMKMLMLLPTLLKVIAAKAIFGLVMGMVSVILSKMAILPLLLSYANRSATHANANTATTGSYRQGVNPTNFALTTDSYNSYYQQEEQPGRITTAMGSIENDIGPADYGPTVVGSDNMWADKYSNKNYNMNGKDTKYIPRKERHRSVNRRQVANLKKNTYPEVVVNERYADNVGLLTTAETHTEKIEKDNLTVRMKRWFTAPHK